MSSDKKIIYTKTDEAPFLATYSLLPIVDSFTNAANIEVELRDISLANRILSVFSEMLPENQRVNDDLAYLGKIVTEPSANVIKLPNISASVPQLKEAIKELQAKGYKLPDFPDEIITDADAQALKLYNKVKGSAVNPVLREGNSDRRAPMPVKQYARNNPHSMGAWTSTSKTHVSTMADGDFKSNEQSYTVTYDTSVSIVHTDKSGNKNILKDGLKLKAGEIIDGTFMSKSALIAFLTDQVKDAKDKGVLFSIHMKATMMKVSDPIIFGHAVRVFFKELFDQYGEDLSSVGANPNNGFGDILSNIQELPVEKQNAIEALIQKIYAERPAIAMVDSNKGITNLHVPSDVIIDASVPALIRNSGQMWNADGKAQDTKIVIPDSSYASIYQATVDFCKENGAFDPRTMGTVPNVGLMAQAAEEYGSHDKTFEIKEDGVVSIIDEAGNILTRHEVEKGDIWRACQTKDAPIRNWVKLAVDRARASHTPAIFWLDGDRAHDRALISKVDQYLRDHDTSGIDISIASPFEAIKVTLARMKEGKDTISVTGNVLRDYNTDLFPILELGTSAKMLSIVPLMNGGGLFETGAGGSAPKHVDQLTGENHLRWDSLGEFLAIAVSLEHFSEVHNNPKAKILANALDKATEKLLLNDKSPSRKVKEIDNRGSHFYLALYWAEALANQNEDSDLKASFSNIVSLLAVNEEKIMSELNSVQGQAVDLGGYYAPDEAKLVAIMRPSSTFNNIISQL